MGVLTWEPYARFLAPGWEPYFTGDDAHLRALSHQVVGLANGPMNVMSVVFLGEVGGIGVVEVAPVAVATADAAQGAHAAATAAVKTSVGWTNMYDFVKAVVNARSFPVTPGGFLGALVGAILRGP